MILIWKGAGILVAVIWFGSVLAGDKLAKALFGPEAPPAIHNLTGEWLAAALTLAFALLLRTQRAIGVDPQTGAEVVTRPNHSLFWVPVGVWPVIFFVLGIVAYYRAPVPNPALFEVTPAAVTKINQVAAQPLSKGWYVRIEVYCQKGVSEPQYDIELVSGVDRTRDYEFRAGGIKFVVLQRQVEMLRGTQLDVEEDDGEQKLRFDSPNLKGDQLEKWRLDLEAKRQAPPRKK